MKKNNSGFPFSSKRKQRWALRKLTIGVVSVLQGIAFVSPSLNTIYAAEATGLDTKTHYTATGIDEKSNLRYSNTVFEQVNEDGSVSLTLTYWFTLASGWGPDKTNQYAGKYLLSFTNPDFYKQIDLVKVANKSLEKHDDGAMWSLPITELPLYALVGVVRNQDVTITLKDGQTIDSLGLADTPIGFNSVMITDKGAIASSSIANGYILKNNTDKKDELDTGFTRGKVTQRVKLNTDDMTIRSIHTFKPNENYLQTDYDWLVYVKEQIPPELLPYIDTDSIKIFNSDLEGNLESGRSEFVVPVDENGLVDTSVVPELSIVGNDTLDQLNAARGKTNDIFWGTLGQSRNYTISYKLKNNVTLSDFARATNDYIEKNNQSFLFNSWMEADYMNQRKPGTMDNGEPPKQLTNSYANAYLDANDTDGDGLFDFVEFKIGSDSTKVDTDGDGVPDNQEFITDHTDPLKADDYLVQKPTTTTTEFDSTKKTTIEGTVPKPPVADPSDASKLIQATNEEAGNVIVKLQGYDKENNTYTNDEYGTTKIPFADLAAGNFALDVNPGVVPDGTDVVLVAYSPNSKNPVMGDPFTFSSGDNAKYEAKDGSVEKDYGVKATEQEILDAVKVTETGKDTEAPAEKITSKTIVGEIPEPSKDGSPQEVTVEVTYADGTKDTAKVALNFKKAAESESINPEPNPIEVKKGDEAPKPEEGIKNKEDLPEGTTYEWKEPVDTTTPGEKEGTVVVTYPDGSTEEVKVPVTVADDDAGKYAPEAQPVEVKKGEEPKAEDGIKNKDTLPEGTKYEWKAPVDTTTPGDKTGTVVVTYPDGSSEEVDVPVKVVTDADQNAPVAQPVEVKKGEEPKAEDGIKNKDELPEDTKYEWKEPVDTTTPGEKEGTVVVTYPDGSSEEIKVPVNVADNDAGKYAPEAQPVEVKKGETPKAEDGIKNKDTLPEGTKYEWKAPVDTTTPGDKTGTVVVTYPDGSSEEVEVPVKVLTDAEANTPVAQPVDVKKGEEPKAEDGIKNKDELPEGTKYEWKEPVDTATPGEKEGTVVVTYPDGSSEEIKVPVNVADNDAGKYTPEAQPVEVNKGGTPKAEDGIKNKDTLPEGTKYEWKAPVDTTTPGDTTGTVVVTYPDGSSEEVEVPVSVVDNTPDAEKYTATGGTVEKPYGQIATADEVLAAVTTDAPADKVKSKEIVGEIPTKGQNQPVNVKVTYADGSEDTATVTLNYGSAADAFNPVGQPIAVDKGTQPNASDAIANKGELPEGTTYTWETPVDTSTPGTTQGTVVVTYPDGSTETVTVDITVNDVPTHTELYTATGGTVNKPYGQIATADEILAAVTTDAPAEHVASIAPVDPIPTEGQNKAVNVKVTYADGSNDTVPVIVNYGLAADAHEPVGQPVNVTKGGQPNAADGIANKDQLPEGTTYAWEAPVDTTTPGKKQGTIVVTYPDGSSEKVVVDVNVADNQSDADKYAPEGQKIDVNKGDTPNPADGIKNKDQLPEGTKYEWKDPIDTTKPGEQKGTVAVTYPDGSKEEVVITINVVDPTTDADKYNPEGQDVNVKPGETPNPADGIKNKDDLPEGTKYEWKDPIDTTKPGEQVGVIVVTYPDGSKEEITTKVNIGTDADKYNPETKPEILKPGQKPDLTDNVTNLKDLPKGTTVKDVTPKGAIDYNKPGEYEGKLLITYPDGSSEEVTVKVKVEKPKAGTGTNGRGAKTAPSVQTGGATNLGAHAAAALASAAALVGVFFSKKRKEEDEEK